MSSDNGVMLKNMLQQDTLQKVGIGVGLLLTIKSLLTLKKQYDEWKLMREKAKLLPTALTEHSSNGFFHTQVEQMPVQTFSPEAYSEYFTRALLSCFSKHAPKDGLLLTWDRNPYRNMFAKCHLYIKDRDIAKELLNAKNQDALVKGRPYAITRPLFGDGVLSANGGLWHAQLKVLGAGLSKEILINRYPAMIAKCNDLVEKLNSWFKETDFVDINLCEEMQKVALDVFGEWAFSTDLKCMKSSTTNDSPFYNAFEAVLSTFHQRQFNKFKFLTSSWYPSSENRKFKKAIRKINHEIRELIKLRKEGGVSNPPKDVLDVLLLGIKNESGDYTQLPDKMLMDNMRTLVFAGHIIMGSTLSWAIDILSRNPDMANKIVEELNSTKSDLTIDKLESCKYFNAFMMELMRLYPGQMIYRTTIDDIQVGKYYIPKGVEIVISPYLIHRSDDTLVDVNDFKPERWLENLTENTLQANVAKAGLKGSYLPFSYGQRKCAGGGFALLEMRMILATLCVNFEFTPSGEVFSQHPHLGVTLQAKDIIVRFKKRT